jgi:hypothetical protein
MLPTFTKPPLRLGPPEAAGVASEGIRRSEGYARQAVGAGAIPPVDVALARRGALVRAARPQEG